MTVKRQMAAALPMLLQTPVTDPVHTMLGQQGKELDINEQTNMVFDIAGWKDKKDVIIDMTPEDEQRFAMQNPAVQKMLQQQQAPQGQTNSKLTIIDSENSARAFLELLRRTIEKRGESQTRGRYSRKSGPTRNNLIAGK